MFGFIYDFCKTVYTERVILTIYLMLCICVGYTVGVYEVIIFVLKNGEYVVDKGTISRFLT